MKEQKGVLKVNRLSRVLAGLLSVACLRSRYVPKWTAADIGDEIETNINFPQIDHDWADHVDRYTVDDCQARGKLAHLVARQTIEIESRPKTNEPGDKGAVS